jgi:hypothetical protein
MHGGLETFSRELFGLSRAGPESGAPEEPLGLFLSERSAVLCDLTARHRPKLRPCPAELERFKRKTQAKTAAPALRSTMVRLGLLALLTAAALASASLALAGTPAENANAAADLRPHVQKKFKQMAPKLALTKVTCDTQADGVTALCQARFTDRPDGIYVIYGIKAVIHDLGGKVTWATTTRNCIDIKSGKKISC